MVESLLLAVTRVTTVNDVGETMTNATGFFYERDGQLFLVTNRHVVLSEETGHHPHSLLIELHIDPENVADITRALITISTDPDLTETLKSKGLANAARFHWSRTAAEVTEIYRKAASP